MTEEMARTILRLIGVIMVVFGLAAMIQVVIAIVSLTGGSGDVFRTIVNTICIPGSGVVLIVGSRRLAELVVG